MTWPQEILWKKHYAWKFVQNCRKFMSYTLKSSESCHSGFQKPKDICTKKQTFDYFILFFGFNRHDITRRWMNYVGINSYTRTDMQLKTYLMLLIITLSWFNFSIMKRKSVFEKFEWLSHFPFKIPFRKLSFDCIRQIEHFLRSFDFG